jgi:hypothetical protein
MEDLSADMRPGKPVSKKMRTLLDREKVETRKRVIERGIVHFRADAEFMALLLSTAEKSKVAPGTLCRRIVWDYLQSMKPASGVAEGRVRYTANQDEVIRRLVQLEALVQQCVKGSKPAKKKTNSRKPASR